MTKIPHLNAIVTPSGSDLLPIEDTSEVETKKMSLAQLVAYLVAQGIGGGMADYEEQTITNATTAITAPDVGKIKYVELSVAANAVFSGLPVPNNSRKIYVIVQRQGFGVKFTKSIDGSVIGNVSDYEIGDEVLSGIGSRITIVDMGTYKIV